MFFKKKKIDADAIAERLASLGVHKEGKGLFLDSDEIPHDPIVDLIKKCKITEKAFRVAEDVLRFSNAYNAVSVFLNLKDKTLKEQILERLRSPALFFRLYERKDNAPRTEIQDIVTKGFELFIDDIAMSERLIIIGANEILASRFMNFVSHGKIGKEDNKATWLALSLGIYNHLKTLPPAITRLKQKLKLK